MRPGEGYKAGVGNDCDRRKVRLLWRRAPRHFRRGDPQLEFAPAHGAEKGLSEAGHTIVLPLLVAREFHARINDLQVSVFG